MAVVQFQGVTRRYAQADAPAVDSLDLEVADGELLVLVGPSGCGKTTSLRMLAGLEPVDEGAILMDGHDITHQDPRRRDVAMVFQSYALYPHMTVAQNIGFHLKVSGVPKAQRSQRVREAAELLDLGDLLDRRPAKLSGGQRQRVAMGRAIVRQPSVFLMDEPLSNLDAKLRGQTRVQIAALQRRLGVTTLYVTHDQVEAMTMGDRVAVMHAGRLQQCAPPTELYLHPANLIVASFVGSPTMNLLDGLIDERGVTVGDLSIPLSPAQRSAATSARLTIGVRPDNWQLMTPDDSEGFAARIEAIETLGNESLLHCRLQGKLPVVVARTPGISMARIGDPTSLRILTHHVFDSVSGERLPS